MNLAEMFTGALDGVNQTQIQLADAVNDTIEENLKDLDLINKLNNLAGGAGKMTQENLNEQIEYAPKNVKM